jgi:hypothetical protein
VTAARGLYLAWRYGGADPFRLYHGLDDDYRPLEDPSLPAIRPVRPQSVTAFIYACGVRAYKEHVEFALVGVQKQQGMR